MATERQRIDGFIADARKGNATDQQIYAKLTASKNLPNLQGFIGDARKGGATDVDIAKHLGLKLQAKSPPKTAEIPTEKPSFMADVGFGMDRVFSAVKQGGLYAKDAVTGGNDYEKFTKAKAEERKYFEETRKKSGKGMNVGGFVGETVATLPAAALVKTGQGVKLATKAGAKFLGQNAAVGAGIGGVGFAENAEQRKNNMLVGAVGGAAGGALGEKAGQGINAINRKFNTASSRHITDARVENQIDIILSQGSDVTGGVRRSDLSRQAQSQLKSEVKKLLQQGRSPDAQTLQRMAVFTDLKSKGFDLKPTGKQATGNAQLWTKETELSKLDGAEALSKKYAQDHSQLKALLDDFELKTGGNASDEFQVGDDIFKALRSQDEGRNNYIAAMYDYAKSHTGNDLALDAGRFANNMKQSLDEDLVDISLLPAPLLKKVEDFSNGVKPFTLAEKEMLVKQINRRMSGADNQTKYALQSFRNSLEKEVDDSLSAFSTNLQGQARAAWDDARKAASGRFGLIDRTPALKKALDDAEPDKAFEQLIWRGNVRQVESLVNEISGNPQALNNVRQAVIKRIAEKSIGVNDVFSPKGMSDALKSIGDRKLELLFSPDELKHLKNIHAAGRYLISQPAGTNVNNANTAAALMNHLGTLAKFPVVKAAVDKWVIGPGRGVNARIKINQGASALSKTAKTTPEINDLPLIDRLVRMGVITGANASTD